MLSIKDVHARDAFVVPDKCAGLYYVFCNDMTVKAQTGPAEGVDYFTTRDFETFEGPFRAYSLPKDAVGHITNGAPEMHFYKGKWYMFDQIYGGYLYKDGTCKVDPDAVMGDYVFVSDKVTGPYKVISDGPVTPNYPCLDGTFFVDKEGQPWMVYSHEWTDLQAGAFEAVRLTDDLSASFGEPVHMFSANEPDWAVGSFDRWPGYEHLFAGEPFWVTDACFMFYDKGGGLCTLWSSRIGNDYIHTFSRSKTGELAGPWEHEQGAPMWGEGHDGGHAMLFKKFDGSDMIIFHHPDKFTHERLAVYPIEYTDFGIRLADDTRPEDVHLGKPIGWKPEDK